jgi:hypothetical protein
MTKEKTRRFKGKKLVRCKRKPGPKKSDKLTTEKLLQLVGQKKLMGKN